MPSPLQAAALRYAAKDLPVFLLAASKRPLENCPACASADVSHDRQACECLTCHGFYAATTDPRRIEAMFALGIRRPLLAIVTGARTGLVVVDADARTGGLDSLNMMVGRGWCPPTAWARTGGGGIHLYYRHPGRRVPGSQSRIAPGIDIKADGGYVVVAPSVHARTGLAYRWEQTEPMAEMAPALLHRIDAIAAARIGTVTAATVNPGAGGQAIAHPDKLMGVLLDRIAQAPEGRRRVTLWACARGAARIVAAGHITATDAHRQLIAACDAAGWPRTKSTPTAIRDGFAAEGVILL